MGHIKIPLKLNGSETELLYLMINKRITILKKEGRNDYIGRTIHSKGLPANDIEIDFNICSSLLEKGVLLETNNTTHINTKIINYFLSKQLTDKEIKAKYNFKIGVNKVLQTELLLSSKTEQTLKPYLSDKYFDKHKINRSYSLRNPNSGTIERLTLIKTTNGQLESTFILMNNGSLLDLSYNGLDSYLYVPKGTNGLNLIEKIRKA